MTTPKHYDVAAYIWPAYTGDEPRTRMFWPEGNGEWETVRKATAKFPGHQWPRRPLWGYQNEADPHVMEMQIDAAADHGVNVFIYDWYWYDDRPFLEQCLNEGFLKARNHDRMRFYLMWANHDANTLWDKRLSDLPETVIWRGAVDRGQFERVGRRLIERYFRHPAYYTIDGKPVFMIYDLANLVRGLGGVEATRDAFAWFRQESVAAGLPGLHLQLTYWNPNALNLSGFDSNRGAAGPELVTRLGFDSLSHYQFCHFTNIDRDYAAIMQDVVREWERIGAEFSIPYFPHVSVGWDNNPRFQSFRPGVVKNNTPELIQKALELARDYADRHPGQPPLITINSWNEWTETSYLQPDDLYGYGYLEAVKAVFGAGGHRMPLGNVAALWRVTEMILDSAVNYSNPYADTEVTVAFHGPGGETIQRPAFWDGGSTWKVRFAPTAPGTWRWSSVCSNAHDAGLHGRAGELTAAAVETDIPLHRHGFLRLSENGRYFVHADGTPFFWLGDTHWQMPDRERVDACNHPEHAGGECPHGGQFQHLLADRIARGFNVYQTYPNATSAHWWSEPFSRIDPARFRALFDVQMDRLADAGMVIALGCGHFNNSTQIPEADLCRFARYLVARYGAHPVVWITCQEMNAPVDLGGKESNRPEVWRAVAEQIARDDGYRHPHSAHQWVYDVDVAPLGQEPWHSWFALQGGHRNSGLTPQARYRGYYDYQPPRPVLETEAMYELVDCGGVNTTDEARQSAWKALLCGSPGYTYGGAGVWFIKWDAADSGCAQYNHAIGSWHEGMNLPGAAQMTVLKRFFVGQEWTALTPRFNDPAWAEWADPERCALATIGNRFYLAYCYGDSSVGTLKKLDPQADYAASWINPRTGEETPIAASVRSRPDGSWPVPAKPAGDWLLWIESRNIPR